MDEEILQKIHDDVIEIKVVLLGSANQRDSGLVGKVNALAVAVSELKRNFWVLVGFLVGTSVLGIGLWKGFG